MSLKKNVLANFVGSFWCALMGLVFVPFYIQLMGVEAYGIVGVFGTLTTVLTILDLGLSQSMNREMARMANTGASQIKICSTVKTLEWVYWVIAILVGLIVFLLSSPIAYYWLKPETLAQEELNHVLKIIALVIALRWPVSLYTGGLNGLQKQVQVNLLTSLITTLQGVGAIVALLIVKPSLEVFFAWQVLISFLQVVLFRIALWRNLPYSKKSGFKKSILFELWRFAVGMSAISLLSIVLTQLDKILLSKFLNLSDFGYYSFATTVAAVLFRLVGPVFTAYYPRLVEFANIENPQKLINAYHQGCQLIAILVFPVGLVLAFFSKEILLIWTQNPNTAEKTSILISVLCIGNILNGIMHMPYALQLAYGWTRLALLQNLISVIVLTPAIYFAAKNFGAEGAACVWVGLNLGYLFISINVLHKRFLPKEKWNWYFKDVLKPLLAVLIISGSARLLVTNLYLNDFMIVLFLLFVSLLTLAGAIKFSSLEMSVFK